MKESITSLLSLERFQSQILRHPICRKRQAKELAALGFADKEAPESAEGKKPDDVDTLVRAIAGTSVGPQRGPSKAQKRRDAKMKQEVEREQRIQQEQSGVVSERVIENQRLAAKLSPLGLALKEIKPDGHCLYRAVEDQLQVRADVRVALTASGLFCSYSPLLHS